MAASSSSAVPTSSPRPGFGDDAHGVLRIGAEGDHVVGDAPHRPHQEIGEREKHQRRGDAGDHQREQQDVDREGPHRLLQRQLVEHDFEKFAMRHRRRAHHAHDVVGLAEQQRVEGVHDGAPPGDAAHVDILRDALDGTVRGSEHAALVAHLDRQRARADALQDLLGEAFRHHAAGRGIEHQRGGVRGGEPVVQPVEPEIGDRRHIDQDFRQHHEQHGEKQAACRTGRRAARAGAPPGRA